MAINTPPTLKDMPELEGWLNEVKNSLNDIDLNPIAITGKWNTNTFYAEGTIIKYVNNIYVSKASFKSITTTPDTDTTNWIKLT